MNNKKGFTLIELLAVIVILAIIALIAVPVIMDVIGKANKSAFKDTAYGIISAGELYYAEQQLELNGMLEDKTFTLPDTTGTLQIKGEVPNGEMVVTTEGKIALAVYNGRYCVTKGYDDVDIIITEDYETCVLPSDSGSDSKTLSDLAVNSTESCMTSGTTCSVGTLFTIQVSNTETKDFYVIADTGSNVTLVMNKNIKENVAWYNETATYDEYDRYVDTSTKGPLTALSELQTATSTWTNLPEMTINTFENGTGTVALGDNRSFTMYARLPKYSEFESLVDQTFIYSGLDSGYYVGYWTSKAVGDADAVLVFIDGYMYTQPVTGFNNDGFAFGLRPVIELSK